MERRKSKQPMPLECKRREDDAWCECEVSIDSMGLETVLRVQFFGSEEETICTLEEANLRMRRLSKPVENDECLQLQEGDVVLAARKHESGKSRFYEAQIIKVSRHEHSLHSPCKCNFEIMWMDGELKGDQNNVCATQIHQVVHGSIHDHSVISRWLKQVKMGCSYQLEASDIESDDQAQLEEELDKITMLACSIEKTNPAEDFTSKALAGEPAGNSEEKDTVGRRRRAKDRVECVARVTRSRTGSHKQPQSVNTVMVRETGSLRSALLFEKRPRLSPLAARAALAAAVQEARPESKVTSKDMHERSVENISFHVEGRHGACRRDQESKAESGTKRKRGPLPAPFHALDKEASIFEESLPMHRNAAEKSGEGSSAKEMGTKRKKGRPSRACSQVDGDLRVNESDTSSPLHVCLDKMQLVAEGRDNVDSVAKRKRGQPPRALPSQDDHTHPETREIKQDMAVTGSKRKRGYPPRSRPLADGESSIMESSQRQDPSHPNLILDQTSMFSGKDEEAHQSEQQVSNLKFRKKSDIIMGGTKDDERKGLSGVVVLADQPIKSLRRSSRLAKPEERSGSDYDARGAIGGVMGGNVAKQGDCVKVWRKKHLASKEIKAVKGAGSCLSTQGPVVGKGKQLQENNAGHEECLRSASRIDLTVELVADMGSTGSPRLQLRNKNVNFDASPSGTCLGITGWLSSPAATEQMQPEIEEGVREKTMDAPLAGAGAEGELTD